MEPEKIMWSVVDILKCTLISTEIKHTHKSV